MTLVTAIIFCAMSQDSLLSVSVSRAHVVFSTAGVKGAGKRCPRKRETAALQRGIQKPRALSRDSNMAKPFHLTVTNITALHHVKRTLLTGIPCLFLNADRIAKCPPGTHPLG